MSYAPDHAYPEQLTFAAQASADERADFISKTYLHLAAAILAFVGLEAVLLNTPGLRDPILSLLTLHRFAPLVFMGGFILVSYVAERWARTSVSPGMQYAGLGLYVVAESVLFMPLLYIAQQFGGDDVIPIAGVVTLTIFTGLTAVVFMTRKNFSFLGPALSIAGFAAFGAIIAMAFLGASPGIHLFFTVAMIIFASGYILYDTSNVLHEYRIGQHVAASLALFASVALLFWYVLRLVMALTSRD